jgi:hypothetical protein
MTNPTDDQDVIDLPQDEDALPPGDDVSGEALELGEQDDAPAEEADDLVITLEGQDLEADDADELPPNIEPKASAAFAKMRADKKRIERELRELKARQEQAAERVQPVAIEPIGDKPVLEEFADAEQIAKYEQDYAAYLSRKSAAEARQKQAEEAQRKESEAWAARLDSYKQEAAKLKRPDFEDAESSVKGTFSTVQQGLLLKHPKNAALIYVLGKNPGRAKALAAISDPVDFAYAAADLAAQVKVERKSAPPPTDTPVRGRTTGAAISSQGLESLKEQGRRTGDYSAYFNAKRAADARRSKVAA